MTAKTKLYGFILSGRGMSREDQAEATGIMDAIRIVEERNPGFWVTGGQVVR